MRRSFAAILAFIAMAAMIWFCACAGDIRWGTVETFMMAMLGCAFSSAEAIFVLSEG